MSFLVRILVVTMFLPVSLAVAKPTPTEALKFLDYYYTGQGQGAVLADIKLCKEIAKEGDEKNNCAEEVSSPLTKGEKYYLWMLYVAPQGDRVEDILVQFNHSGITHSTKKVSVNGSFRYRTWKTFKLTSSGTWDIKILHPKDGNVEELGKLQVTVE